jgi:uncharacterized protein (TIGR02118 family)
MYKLVILIPLPENSNAFDKRWPEFLSLAEGMPGLLKETSSRVDRKVYGDYDVQLIHELYFDSLKEAASAMGSLEGEKAGQLLQEITDGRVSLLLADHTEDNLSNIRSHQKDPNDAPPGNRA